MSETYTIRLPKDLRAKMAIFRIEWSDEIKKFLEVKVKQLELLQLIDEIGKKVEDRKTDIDSTRLIREYREVLGII
jgi:hypothetical protein